jgi:hypothetical protein
MGMNKQIEIKTSHGPTLVLEEVTNSKNLYP